MRDSALYTSRLNDLRADIEDSLGTARLLFQMRPKHRRLGRAHSFPNT